MSIKIIADSRDEFPENLRGDAEEKDGKFELEAAGLINKNKELLKDNSKLKAKNEDLVNDAETAKAERDEWKGKAKLPAGQKLVSIAVAELGEAAQTASLSKDELQILKTENERFRQNEIETAAASLRETAGEKLGYNKQAFARLAKDLNIVRENDADFVQVTNDKGATEKMPLTKDFVEKSDVFKPFLSSLTEKPKPGTAGDPPPTGEATNLEADKKAKSAQTFSLRNRF